MVSSSNKVEASGRTYTIVGDLATHFEVLVAGQVLSVASNAPVPQFSIDVHREDVYVKIMRDGFFCLAGYVDRLFPNLDSTPYSLDMEITAPHYQALSQNVPVAVGSSFPLASLTVPLAYEALRIQGRVTDDIDGSAVPGARVTVNEPDVLTLRTPLHFDHASGTPIRACLITPAGATRKLAQPAVFQDTTLFLDDSAGLVAGSILRLGSPAFYEFVVVDGTGPGAGEVQLRGGLRRSYPFETAVLPVNQVSEVTGPAVSTAAATGQGLLWLDADLSADAIAIQDADSGQNEFHALDALSDDAAGREGNYQIDGVTTLRVAKLDAANPADTHKISRSWLIDPRRPVNIVNLRLT